MYRIRFHGRGGQGIKTASRILGTAFFLEGFEVQDAPRYGAERRGAPISAYVRASREAINERGVIEQPDLVVAVDPSLVALAAAGVQEGAGGRTVLLLNAARAPLGEDGGAGFPGRVVLLPDLGEEAARGPMPLLAVAMAGAACRLTGVISGAALREAVAEELSSLEEAVLAHNMELALSAFNRLDTEEGSVSEGGTPDVRELIPPAWIELPLEELRRAAPTIYSGGTTLLVKTGLWRTERPVIDPAQCKHCWWICGTFCPDGVIAANSHGVPQIDYDHCKGCLICLAQCPSHAITAVPETGAEAAEQEVRQ